MDDGIGMSDKKVHAITEKLHTHTEEPGQEKESIGLKNTYDRIVKNYGQEYGFTITSCEELGTIFEYRLPILEDKEC